MDSYSGGSSSSGIYGGGSVVNILVGLYKSNSVVVTRGIVNDGSGCGGTTMSWSCQAVLVVVVEDLSRLDSATISRVVPILCRIKTAQQLSPRGRCQAVSVPVRSLPVGQSPVVSTEVARYQIHMRLVSPLSRLVRAIDYISDATHASIAITFFIATPELSLTLKPIITWIYLILLFSNGLCDDLIVFF